MSRQSKLFNKRTARKAAKGGPSFPFNTASLPSTEKSLAWAGARKPRKGKES